MLKETQKRRKILASVKGKNRESEEREREKFGGVWKRRQRIGEGRKWSERKVKVFGKVGRGCGKIYIGKG